MGFFKSLSIIYRFIYQHTTHCTAESSMKPLNNALLVAVLMTFLPHSRHTHTEAHSSSLELCLTSLRHFCSFGTNSYEYDRFLDQATGAGAGCICILIPILWRHSVPNMCSVSMSAQAKLQWLTPPCFRASKYPNSAIVRHLSVNNA